nr:restriction endonuclease subunit S [Kribbella qitaiheensis]
MWWCGSSWGGSVGEWRPATLDQLVKLQRGHDLPTSQRRNGSVPVMGAAGQSGTHDTALVKAPGVVLGRAGASMGKATYCDVDFWPLNTSLYVTDFLGNDPRFVYYLLGLIDFSGYNSGAAQPMLNRNYIKRVQISLPELPEQRAIAGIIGALDDKIVANERVAAMARELWRRARIRSNTNGDAGKARTQTIRNSGDSIARFVDNGSYQTVELKGAIDLSGCGGKLGVARVHWMEAV